MADTEESPSRGPSNTPAQRTENRMTVFKHLRVLIDYVSFTINADTSTVYHVLDFFEKFAGVQQHHWVEGFKNYEGYADSKTFENIRIYYNGAENQGIHVDITGQGCRYLETQFQKLGVQDFNWYEFLSSLRGWDAKFSRVDVATDDFHGLLDIPQMFNKCLSGQFTSKFKSWEPKGKFDNEGNTAGLSLYFGSAQSRIQIVFYEKGKQLGLGYHWSRLELRMFTQRADEFIDVFLAQTSDGEIQMQIGVLFAGIVKDYITFRDRSRNDSNKRRWKVSAFWAEFLEGVEPLRLASALPDRSIQRIRTWVNDQVSKSFAMMFYAYNEIPGHEQWMREILSTGSTKMTKRDLEIIEEYRRLFAQKETVTLMEQNPIDVDGKGKAV